MTDKISTICHILLLEPESSVTLEMFIVLVYIAVSVTSNGILYSKDVASHVYVQSQIQGIFEIIKVHCCVMKL